MKRFFNLALGIICFGNLHSAITPAYDDSLHSKKQKTEYEVSLLNGVNTTGSEFCAVSYSNGIIFVANQLKDLVNNESFDVNGVPYVDVFSATVSNYSAENIKPFSKKINGAYHDGPASLNSTQTQLYLTRVDYLNKGSKKFTNRAKLLIFDKKENSWSEPTAFAYNGTDYSTGHASVSQDGKYLFFASDRPGGYGGKDLYVCMFNGKDWNEPENLGPGINTEKDEEFPFIRNDGMLFFSSNGHKGQGGFDIFSATAFGGKWRLKRNEGEIINSEADDFGIVFKDSVSGYFSSNRKGGPGGDDIYRFSFTPMGMNISATVLLTENIQNPAINTLIYLLNKRGKKIDSTRTNTKGFFQFRNLYGDKQFLASVDPEDIHLKGKARFYLANDKGEVVRVSHQFKKFKFVFKDLPFDKNELPELYSGDDLILSGVLTYSNNPVLFASGARLAMVNTFGDVVDTAVTNELGYFVFKNLAPGQDYLVKVIDSSLHLPDNTVVTLSDKNGKKLKSFIVGKDAFAFKLLSPEKNNLSELSADEDLSLSGGNCNYGQGKLELKPRTYKKIYLIDSKGNKLDSVITDRRGFFKFRNIDAELLCMAAADQSDNAEMNGFNYYLVTDKGVIVKAAYPFRNWKYTFRNISADSLSLQEIPVSDNVFLAGNLRSGERAEDALAKVRLYMVDARGKIVDSVVTNEYGCFAFRNLPADQNYLMTMNESDIKLPLNTRVVLTDKNGKTVKTFFYGKDRFEYQVLAAEKNFMKDMEVYDNDLTMKLNGYVYDGKKQALANVTLVLYDSTGSEKQIIRTDTSGRFLFRYFKPYQASRIEIIADHITDSVIYIGDARGKIYKSLVRSARGRFEYHLLEQDKMRMGDYTIDDPWLNVLQMERKGESVTIVERIFYATNDFKFDTAGQKVLDKTITILNANPKLVLELSSHTDARSNDKYNLNLSNKRAQFAVDYIISKGITQDRVKAIGYGETKLLNNCSNKVKCTEKEHAMNRRTEFKISLADRYR